MAASPLDFYLPPPDDRAYRREKIQRLRDQITAWRRHPPRPDHTSPNAPTLPSAKPTTAGTAAMAVELPRWRAAVVSPTRVCASRREKLFQQSCMTESRQRGRSGGAGRKQTYARSGHANTAVSRVAELPYFHDQTIFCAPLDRHNTANSQKQQKEKEKENEQQGRDWNVDMWYGVTSNSEERRQELELGTIDHSDINTTARDTENNSSHGSSKITSNGNNKGGQINPHCSNKFALAHAQTTARDVNLIDSFFAQKIQSVELAMSVHAERMRRKSVQQGMRKKSLRQQQDEEMFSKSMEIPIDWDEFRRLSPDRTTSRANTVTLGTTTTLTSNRHLNTNDISPTATNNTVIGTNKPVAVAKTNNSTSGTLSGRAIHSGNAYKSSHAAVGDVETTWGGAIPRATTPHNRPPLRLYAIRVRRNITNSDTSMLRTAEAAPRLGTRVVLSNLWMN